MGGYLSSGVPAWPGSSLEIGLAAIADAKSPTESAANWIADSGPAIESPLLSITNPVMADGWPPIEILRAARSDSGAVESLGTPRADLFDPAEAIGSVVINGNAPAEAGASVAADGWPAAESLTNAVVDGALVESGAILRIDADPPAESGGSLVVDRSAPIASGSSARIDATAWAEIVSAARSVAGDAWAQIEALGTIVRDGAPIEWVALFRIDMPPLAEAGTAARVDPTTAAESAALAGADSWPAAESSGTQRVDAPSAAEVLLTAGRDGAALEILALGARRDASAPYEYGGAILRIFDPAFPVESIAVARVDAPALTELLTAAHADGAEIEWLSVIPSLAIAANGFAPLEARGTFAANQSVALSSDALSKADAAVVAEWLQRQTADPVANSYVQIEALMTLPPPLVYVSAGRLRSCQPTLAQPRAFAPLAPGDIDNFAFDFTAEIGAAAIVSTAWTCALRPLQTAMDPQPQSHIEAPPAAQTAIGIYAPQDSPGWTGLGSPPQGYAIARGAFSTALVGGFAAAEAGALYTLTATVATSDGRTLSVAADLPIQ
jgi:hypothetical protein